MNAARRQLPTWHLYASLVWLQQRSPRPDKLIEATKLVPWGRNNQEPGTEVPGKLTKRIESRKGRHRITFNPIRLFGARRRPPTCFSNSGFSTNLDSSEVQPSLRD